MLSLAEIQAGKYLSGVVSNKHSRSRPLPSRLLAEPSPNLQSRYNRLKPAKFVTAALGGGDYSDESMLSGSGSKDAKLPLHISASSANVLTPEATTTLTQRLVWLSAALTALSFVPAILASGGAATSAPAVALTWLGPLRGAAAFVTLTSVFTEIQELPAFVVHALGGVGCLTILSLAVSSGQMPALPLQLVLAAAAIGTAINVPHWSAQPQPPVKSAIRLRQWLWFLGCINCGLLGQALGASVAVTFAISGGFAAATVALNRLKEGTYARRRWLNMPALAATLLLVWDCLKPLAHPSTIVLAVPATEALASMVANACLVPRALSLSNTMFFRATSFFTTAKWATLSFMVATAGQATGPAAGAPPSRAAFAVVTVALGCYVMWLYKTQSRFPH